MKKKDLVSKPIVDLALAYTFKADIESFIKLWENVGENSFFITIPHSKALKTFATQLIYDILKTSDCHIAASEKHGAIIRSKEFPEFVILLDPHKDDCINVYVRCKDCGHEDYLEGFKAVEDDEAGIYICCPICDYLQKDYIV